MSFPVSATEEAAMIFDAVSTTKTMAQPAEKGTSHCKVNY